jgi:hypothetical protein
VKKYVVIPWSHLPAKLPLVQSIVAWMALDFYGAPGWLWGVLGTLFAALWVAAIVAMGRQESRPLPGYGADDK